MDSSARFENFLLNELWQAYFTARKGKKHTVDEHRFELNAMANVIDLKDVKKGIYNMVVSYGPATKVYPIEIYD